MKKIMVIPIGAVLIFSGVHAQQVLCPERVVCSSGLFGSCTFSDPTGQFELDRSNSSYRISQADIGKALVFVGAANSSRYYEIPQSERYIKCEYAGDVRLKTKSMSSADFSSSAKWDYLDAAQKITRCDPNQGTSLNPSDCPIMLS